MAYINLKKDQNDLISWYRQNKRVLPWRENKDPYRIWISEVMLQQTTVAAVVPYYEKFMTRFPTIKHLALADESDVLEMWAGLGYYSRARNLHKSAKILAEKDFLNTAAQLIELPGFGPYTSRAVASLAFSQPVGVLDGNVIRVLSRFYGLKIKWWDNKEKLQLQKFSDELANTEFNSDINQGLMELGATVCTPKKPICLLCPWKNRCVAFEKNLVEKLPLAKPKQDFEIWHWTFYPEIKKNKILLNKNETVPFLKKMMFPTSKAKKLTEKPKQFDLKHSVTKYAIYISIKKGASPKKTKAVWVEMQDIKKINPTSLMTKILKFVEKSNRLNK